MIVGLDLDNTIVCYDEAIKRLADRVEGLPTSTPKTKLGVREFLRQQDREDDWTEFQGALYGPGMTHAEPFPDAIDTIKAIQTAGHSTVIISHRTQYPYLGPRYDLHQSARNWIESKLVVDGVGLFESANIYLNESKDKKVALIGSLECDIFLDDLVDILSHASFPSSVQKLWFAPHQDQSPTDIPSDVVMVKQWTELSWLSKN